MFKYAVASLGYRFPRATMKIREIISRDEWDFIKGGGNGGSTPLDGVNKQAEELGAGVYTLARTIAIICLVLAIVCVGAAFVVSKNPNTRKENKDWLIWIFIGGAMIFGVFTLINIISGIGNSL